MILSVEDQGLVFLTTVCIGVFIGIFYDCFRILRKVIAHNNFFIHIEDGLFWIASSLFGFYIMLHRNYGEIRFFVILGILIGLTVYFLTVSNFIVELMVKLLNIIFKAVQTFFYFILYPVGIIYRILKPFVRKGKKRSRKVYKSSRNLLCKCKSYVKIKIKKAKISLRAFKKTSMR